MADDEPKSCFVICPIGKEGGTTRQRSDKLLRYVIKEVLEPKYLVERADQLAEPGIITNQIVKKIVDCDILIADLTEGNPNVFYELAIRHGLKKPFIHIIDANEKIPFDNAQVRTIQIDLSDLDSVHRAKAELQNQISAIESGKTNAESPISVAFDLEALRTSGNSDESLLATLFEEVRSLRGEMRAIRRDKPPQMRLIAGPSSEKDLYEMLIQNGEFDLAARFDNATIHTFEPGNLILSTSDPIEEDQKFEQDLTEFLRKVSRRLWVVSVLPF